MSGPAPTPGPVDAIRAANLAVIRAHADYGKPAVSNATAARDDDKASSPKRPAAKRRDRRWTTYTQFKDIGRS